MSSVAGAMRYREDYAAVSPEMYRIGNAEFEESDGNTLAFFFNNE